MTYSIPAEPTKSSMSCLICHYDENEPNKGDHIAAISTVNKAHVCKECVIRAQTVTNFGLTVDELKIAALQYKDRERNK